MLSKKCGNKVARCAHPRPRDPECQGRTLTPRCPSLPSCIHLLSFFFVVRLYFHRCSYRIFLITTSTSLSLSFSFFFILSLTLPPGITVKHDTLLTAARIKVRSLKSKPVNRRPRSGYLLYTHLRAFRGGSKNGIEQEQN